jgi:hypothetical protein
MNFEAVSVLFSLFSLFFGTFFVLGAKFAEKGLPRQWGPKKPHRGSTMGMIYRESIIRA